jgi:DNA-binding CsgD family transcriptional regulator
MIIERTENEIRNRPLISRGRKPELYMVDGREMTAMEIADMLGITKNALCVRRNRLGGISMQAVVNMYRDNQFGSDCDRAQRFRIEGEWLTRRQIAERLGVSRHSISQWRSEHGCAMEEAVEHFRHWNEGGRKHNPQGLGGRSPKVYVVGNREYTVPGVAKKYGKHPMSVRCMLKSRGGDMGKVLACYQAKERRKRQRAEKEILRILGY